MATSQAEDAPDLRRLGVVVIGRNEGHLLVRALGSITEAAGAVVYADSDSSDDSVQRVRDEFPNVHVVQLDPSRPMNPARGRNEGMARLTEVLPDVELIQFLDGDCDLAPDWLRTAVAYFDEHPRVGIVCGRLRERERERNAYHRLADMEWAQPPGEIDDLGGIMVVRRSVWDEVGGQNSNIPAAEEREFCRRARAAGWVAMRLPEDMAQHDIDMARFGEWWTRMARMGHSWAQGLWIYRDGPHLRHVLSMALWGGVVPAAALLGMVPTLGTSVPVAGLAHRRLWRRIAEDRAAQGDRDDDAKLYASAMLAAKFAGTLGIARFVLQTLPAGRGGRRS
ncbi:MAG: glycosyltransferase [Myxococcota bacterium]